MDELKHYPQNITDSRLEHLTNQNFTSSISNTNHLLTEEIFCQTKKVSSNLIQIQQTPSSTSNLNVDNDRGNWYHECEDTNNPLNFNHNSTTKSSVHDDSHDICQNSRYNVKGIRNERTSFFDIPAVTHPYCYRFSPSPSSQNILKKEPIDVHHSERVFSGHHSSSLQISQHFPHHHHHHHHHIQYPDSTTNQNHQTIIPSNISSSINNSSYPYHTNYSLRSLDTSIVSSTDTDLSFGTLYTGNGPITSNTLNQRRGSLQLWQFLVALLDEPSASSGCIAWTGRGMEFKLIEPEEVARRWGIQKNRPAMNYDKLSRSLRYYYEKGIMQKVAGERYVYKFVCDPEALFNMAYGHSNNTDTNFSLNKNSNNVNCSSSSGGGGGGIDIPTTLSDAADQIKSTSSYYSGSTFHSNLK